MSDQSFLLTGFPGFLGTSLLPRLLRARPDSQAHCLIQSKFRPLALERLSQLEAKHPDLIGRVQLQEGDITVGGLGLGVVDTSKVTEVFHLAAVYDLAVSREIGMKVNVEGTRNVLDWAQSCQNLKRFHHVSTCYVSGRYCGIFRESDLDKGQRFNNYYEETKFLSEVDVASRQSEGLPTTIYRPAITVGDSVTGSTQKYDGVYFFTSLLLRQPRWLSVLPIVGDQDATRVNLVSSDFVVQAIAELSSHSESLGRVYQLADPNPLTVREVIDSCARCTGRNPFKIKVPKGLARWSLKNIKLARKLLGLPAEAIDYFVLPTHYTSDNTVADLEGTGIAAKPLTSYFQTLVDFQMANPHGAVGPML